MSIPGKKILIDLGDQGTDKAQSSGHAALSVNFIGDVQERQVTQSVTPQPPTPRSTGSGFPAHRKRLHESRFKSARSTAGHGGTVAEPDLPPSSAVPLPNSVVPGKDERQQIDAENQHRLDSMTDAEIQQERQELLENINPAILQALLRRSKLETGDDQTDFPGLQADHAQEIPKKKKPVKRVAFDDAATGDNISQDTADSHKQSAQIDIPVPHHALEDGEPPLSPTNTLPTGSIHFPRPDQPPDLDPNSVSFLEDLHRKYFPSLPSDPEKLEWMRPASGSSSYSPTQSALDPKDIRFSFSGALIPPSEAADIPVTAGLHHHGEAPEAAGYTIPELARLARSKVPAQRCIAFQTLGRILYRLGKGEFGNPSEGTPGTVGAEDTLGELARGLWAEVEKEQVVNICTSESEGKSMTGQRHVSAQAYATEAIWLWQQGGGRRWRTD